MTQNTNITFQASGLMTVNVMIWFVSACFNILGSISPECEE